MRFIGETFPLLVCVAPKRYDAAAVQLMADTFEGYFARAERYAFVCVQPEGSIAPGANERKLLADWVRSPRVREQSGRLCVAAATTVNGSVMRGALTAIMWFWTPPFTLKVVASASQGIDFCLAQLTAAKIQLLLTPEGLKMRALSLIDSALAGPSRVA